MSCVSFRLSNLAKAEKSIDVRENDKDVREIDIRLAEVLRLIDPFGRSNLCGGERVSRVSFIASQTVANASKRSNFEQTFNPSPHSMSADVSLTGTIAFYADVLWVRHFFLTRVGNVDCVTSPINVCVTVSVGGF